MKPALSALITAALIFLAFSFVKVSFDITLWSEGYRFLCMWLMLVVGGGAFCGVKAADT